MVPIITEIAKMTNKYSKTDAHWLNELGIMMFAINDDINSIFIEFAQLNKAKSKAELSRIITS